MSLRLVSTIPLEQKIQARKKTPRDLTMRQVLALLSCHGGAGAAAVARDLRMQSGQAPGAEDFCTIAMLGLVAVDRSGRFLTDKGLIWSDRIIGD